MDRAADSKLRRLLLATVASGDADVPALARGLDLNELARVADHHGVMVMAFARLEQAGVEVPEVLAQRIAHTKAAVQARRLHAQRTIAAIAAEVDAPFLVIKGPMLATRWYDDPDHRDFNDIDVLTRRGDFERVLDDLSANGFDLLSANWQGFLDYEVAEVPLAFETSIVDLHWHPIGIGRARLDLRFDETSLFLRSVASRLGQTEVSTFDDVDTLLHRCVHCGLDGAGQLRSLVDIDRIVASQRVDLDEFADRARQAGAQALCAAVLQRCGSTIGTDIDGSFLQELSPWREWLPVNGWIDHRGASGSRSTSEAVAAGFLLASGRSSRRASLIDLARRTPARIALGRGRPGLTEAGGPLDWQRRPAPHEVDERRRAYLDWVGDVSSIRVRRCPDADELHRLLGHLQPRTTPMLGAAFLDGLDSRRCRADLLEQPDGKLAGALVRYRWALGRCTGFPLLVDQQAAADLAQLIDGSNVTDLAGLERDTEPLRSRIERWRSVAEATVATLEPGFLWEEEYPTTRRATEDDLDVITDLVWTHAPHAFVNVRLLKRRIRRAISDLGFVVEAGEPRRVVGVALRDSATPEYHYWAQIVIDPAFREQGLSWHLIAAGAAEASRCGVGGLALVAASNPMPVPADAKAPESWTFVTLDPPRRVKGERRARRALDVAIGSRGRESLAVYRNPGGDDRLTSERRRQQWWRDRFSSR